MASELQIRDGGSFKVPDDVQYHNGSSWNPVDSVWVRRGGSWEKHWPADFTPTAGAGYTNLSSVTVTGADSWSTTGMVVVPSSARSSGVATLTGGYARFQFINPSDDGDDNLANVSARMTVRGKYTAFPTTTANMSGIIWSGFTTVASGGVNHGGVAIVNVPSGYGLVGIGFGIRYVASSDDTPTNGTSLQVRLRVGYAQVLASGGGAMTINYSGSTVNTIQTASAATGPTGDPAPQTTDISIPTNNFATAVRLGAEILGVGADEGAPQHYDAATARTTFGISHRNVTNITP